MMDERDDASLAGPEPGFEVSAEQSGDDEGSPAKGTGAGGPRGYPGAPIIDIVMSRGVSGGQAGHSARSARRRLAPPLMSLAVPGLGQAWQREYHKASLFLAAGVVLWVVKLGWIVHLVAMVEASRSAGGDGGGDGASVGGGAGDGAGDHSIRTRVPCSSRSDG